MTEPERAYADYLRDILDAAEKARQFVGDMDTAAFEADDKTVFAVIRALEIIGRAHPDDPVRADAFKQYRGTRPGNGRRAP